MPDKEEFVFKHVAVEGVMKSGKTLLADLLCRRLGGRAVLDKTDNPYLSDFYEEKEGSSFLTQLVFLVSRYHQQVRLAQRDLFEERIFCDYMFEKDKIYAYQTLTDDELVVYDRIYGILSERIPKADLVIYLQIGVPTLLRRIGGAGTSMEKNISEKYLEDLVEAFDYFFFNYQQSPLLIVKADSLDLSREEDLEEVVRQLRDMKARQLYYVPLGDSEKGSRRKG
ncbi:MAG: deoxynucleoside kinase [Candidatus Aminicenantes bacterium]|nr:deoxynucleoside kinase [Candidatus Aminicenantes bacterium]